MVEKGKRVSVRWTEDRVGKLEELGWENLDDGTIIDNALDYAAEHEK